MVRVLDQKEQKVSNMLKGIKKEHVEVENVTFRAGRMIYGMKDPAVYKISNTNVTLVFGQVVESMDTQEMAKRFLEHLAKQKLEAKAKEEEVETKNETVEEQINEEDINLIVQQTGVSREEAIEAMKKSNNDTVSALVALNKALKDKK